MSETLPMTLMLLDASDVPRLLKRLSSYFAAHKVSLIGLDGLADKLYFFTNNLPGLRALWVLFQATSSPQELVRILRNMAARTELGFSGEEIEKIEKVLLDLSWRSPPTQGFALMKKLFSLAQLQSSNDWWDASAEVYQILKWVNLTGWQLVVAPPRNLPNEPFFQPKFLSAFADNLVNLLAPWVSHVDECSSGRVELRRRVYDWFSKHPGKILALDYSQCPELQLPEPTTAPIQAIIPPQPVASTPTLALISDGSLESLTIVRVLGGIINDNIRVWQRPDPALADMSVKQVIVTDDPKQQRFWRFLAVIFAESYDYISFKLSIAKYRKELDECCPEKLRSTPDPLVDDPVVKWFSQLFGRQAQTFQFDPNVFALYKKFMTMPLILDGRINSLSAAQITLINQKVQKNAFLYMAGIVPQLQRAHPNDVVKQRAALAGLAKIIRKLKVSYFMPKVGGEIKFVGTRLPHMMLALKQLYDALGPRQANASSNKPKPPVSALKVA